MGNVGIKGTAYCLNFAPELALHYGGHARPGASRQARFRVSQGPARAGPEL